MDEEAKALIIILQTLARRGVQAHRALGMAPNERLPDEKIAGSLIKTIKTYALLDDNHLSDLLKSPISHEFDEDKFIPLEKSRYTGSGFGYLWCKWNFGGEPSCGFYYGYFRLGPKFVEDGAEVVKGHIPQFVGYRFESPGWRGTEHRFFHAQPTTSMSPARRTIQCALPRPDDAPTFPLPVKTISGLLLCLVLSVLGRDLLEEIVGNLQNDRRLQRNAHLQNAIAEVSAIVI